MSFKLWYLAIQLHYGILQSSVLRSALATRILSASEREQASRIVCWALSAPFSGPPTTVMRRATANERQIPGTGGGQ